MALISGWRLSAGVGQEPGAVPPDVRQSWENDYAGLKAALSKRDNPYERDWPLPNSGQSKGAEVVLR